MLFKILHGDKSRISLDITPYHEGYCYVTHDGDFYVDMNNERVKLNAKDAETLMGASLATILNSSNLEIPTSKAVLTALAGKANATHSHNDLYYTEAEVDTLIANIDLEIPVQDTAPEDGELWVDTSEDGEILTPGSIGAYTKSEVNSLISTHNTNTSAHNDIRTAVTNAQTTANAAQTAANGKVPITRTVNGKTLSSDITLTASDIGLGSVNNTADSAKSVKYATSAGTLTNLTATVTELNYTDGVTSNIQTQLNGKLSAAGGTLTGNLSVPSGTDYTTAKIRNIKASTTDLTAGTSTLASGDIYLVYE